MLSLIITGFLIALALCIVLLKIQARFMESLCKSKDLAYLGNGTIRLILNSITGKSFLEDNAEQYLKLKASGKSIGVSSDFGTTTFTIADKDLLKAISVKDFDHFTDRRGFSTGGSDYVYQRNLIMSSGEAFKQLRSKLSPIFTTGKMKRMFHQFDASGQKFVHFLKDEIGESADIDLAEAYTKYTLDIIAPLAFGMDSGSFDQKEPSYFDTMSKGLQFDSGLGTMLKFAVVNLCPRKLVEYLDIAIFEKQTLEYFDSTIRSVIKQRETTGNKQDDFIQLMLEARAGTLKSDESELDAFERDALLKVEKTATTAKVLDDAGIVANATLFVVAGYDATQSLLLFVTYVLATYHDIQDKLRKEIDAILKENNGRLTYDSLSKMEYLDMLINETLRYYPSFTSVQRNCTMDYRIPGSDIVIRKGDAVLIPIYGMHHDAEYFPEPEKFDPERFSPKNRHNIIPYTFIPFGQGPRNCIGRRFALTEAKNVLTNLVHNFKLDVCSKISMKYSMSIPAKPKEGMLFNLTRIVH